MDEATSRRTMSAAVPLPGASGTAMYDVGRDWIAAFAGAHPEAGLTLSSVGSGAAQAALWGGVNCGGGQLVEETHVAGAASADDALCGGAPSAAEMTLWGMGGAMFSEEDYKVREPLGLHQLPALGGPIVVTYSKDVTGELGLAESRQLNMSLGTIVGIFNGTIDSWDHAAIRDENPNLDVDLPNKKIAVFVRSDASGMSEDFTNALKAASPYWPDDAVGNQPSWPLPNLTTFTQSQVDDGDEARHFSVTGQTGIGVGLLRQPYSVGYLEAGYLSSLSRFLSQTNVSSPTNPGVFVPANAETLNVTMDGLAHMINPKTLSLHLVEEPTPPGGYPLTRYVYWYLKFAPAEYESCFQAWLLYQFVVWTYRHPTAGEIAKKNGWVVPPPSVARFALARLDKLTCIDKDGSLVRVAAYIPPEYSEDNHLEVFGYILMGIAVLASLGFAIWTVLKRKNSVVKASQPQFLLIICTGTLVMAAAIFTNSIDDRNWSQRSCDIACMATPWLVSSGFCITFSALFSKIWRINRLTESARQFRRVTVTPKDVIWPFAVLFSLNCAFLLAWQFVDPLRWVRRPVDGSGGSSWYTYGTCLAEGSAYIAFGVLLGVVDICALVIACIQAYRSRNLSVEYSEGRYIGLGVMSWLQVALIGIPILFLVRDDPSASYFVETSFIFIVSMSMLLLIFVPKAMHMRAQAKEKADRAGEERNKINPDAQTTGRTE